MLSLETRLLHRSAKSAIMHYVSKKLRILYLKKKVWNFIAMYFTEVEIRTLPQQKLAVAEKKKSNKFLPLKFFSLS